MENIEQVFSHFATKGKFISYHQTGNGHINGTYVVETTERKYILQQINTNVFKDVKSLMNNVIRITEHLQENGVFTLRYKPTYDGLLYYQNGNACYRVYKYIENAKCFEGIGDNMSLVKQTGFAFGNLHRSLSDINPKDIVDVIPDFHNITKRYKSFCIALEKDSFDRASEIKSLIQDIKKRESVMSILWDSLQDGSINNHITHNDPKINNVLFDKDTLEVKAVIDLDTVMTGTVLFDFGDGLRSLFTGEFEDSPDLSKIKINFDIYRNYLEGYYSAMKGYLNDKEIDLLPISVGILALELGIRFLTDYLNGDTYFAISREKQNLDRAKTQIKLANDVFDCVDKLKEITKEICK